MLKSHKLLNILHNTFLTHENVKIFPIFTENYITGKRALGNSLNSNISRKRTSLIRLNLKLFYIL